MRKTLLVFTGGGLAPTLNATLFGVISEAQKNKFRILGGMEGWSCLLPEGKIVDLTKVKVEALKNHGGAFLKSSRVNPLKEVEGINHIKNKMKEERIDVLIPIGGNDTLGATKELFEQFNLPVVGIPKTVDNDLSATYWAPGFPTAATKLSRIARQIKEEAAYALKRIFLIETMGRSAGWIAASSCLAEPDIILVPERKIIFDSFIRRLKERYEENGSYATVVMAEEVNFDKEIDGMIDQQSDQYLKQARKSFVSIRLREEVMKELGIYAQVVIPRNFLQSGLPIAIDKEFAIKLGQKAVRLVKEENFGMMSNIIRPNESKKQFKVSSIPLNQVVGEKNYHVLDDTWFNFEEFTASDKFKDYIGSFTEEPETSNDYHELINKVLKS